MLPESAASQALIETARLELRRLAVGDRAFYCGLYADSAVMRWVGRPLGRARAERAFERLHAGSADPAPGFRVWAIRERGSREPIGICGLTEKPPGAGRAELGILLAPTAWGRGIALEALAALSRPRSMGTGVTEFALRHRSENPAMAKIALRLGLNPLPSAGSDGCCAYSGRRPDLVAEGSGPGRDRASLGVVPPSICHTGDSYVRCDRIS